MHRCIPIPGPSDPVLDPRTRKIKFLNRFTVLSRGAALAIDPLFLFAITVSPSPKPCIYIDGTMLLFATLLRTFVDLLHGMHLWLKFRMAYVAKESLVSGSGVLVWDSRAVVKQYVGSPKGFWFDLFVILPVPQAVYWLILPELLKQEKVKAVMTISHIIFLLQFFPKLYHSFYLMHGVKKVTGYIFGTALWGLILNLIAYFLASHVSGGFWYSLSVQRIAECLKKQCHVSKQCETLAWTCPREICYSSFTNSCLANSTMKGNFSTCMDQNGEFPFGNYAFALPLIVKNSNVVKILYSGLWGIMSLSTMGSNFDLTSQTTEVSFAIVMVLAGLSLFTFLIGNIQVFFHSVTPRRRQMQLRYCDIKWWMGRRQIPSELRRRVRHYEQERWKVMGGQDEMKLIKNMPDGLRRDIKRYLCLDLVRKVPLFDNLDDLILDHICDRVIPMVYSANEKILKEGEPVQRMVFIVKGSVMRSQNITQDMVTTTPIEPGGFIGDELIAWCLRIPFVDRFPPSSATFTCVEPVEAYGLNSDQLKHITNHFRYTFSRGELKYKTRYYSSNWRSWAAVNIQFAWRRYWQRTRGDFINRGTGNAGSSDDASTSSDQKLRHFAAMFMSLRPKDHLD
ncbi:cyclic nucleotide-gated ion channel 2 [Daucus carota subsp. sativus]|uniref:Cyclic nucleotide-binding domain-containing protein n=1 Tax=Daucus carota subsp. sativus TaxID=79200 RepID=A0A175YRC9_DAUCS|nr:PREDICTED: cyclic nucleotide-gated ion channel 2-like [Daucus carota subsp. sativus]